jgi:hypothetical protein
MARSERAIPNSEDVGPAICGPYFNRVFADSVAAH